MSKLAILLCLSCHNTYETQPGPMVCKCGSNYLKWLNFNGWVR